MVRPEPGGRIRNIDVDIDPGQVRVGGKKSKELQDQVVQFLPVGLNEDF